MKRAKRSIKGVLWERDTDSEQTLKDAIAIAREIVRLDARAGLQKAVLNTLIWNVTVSDGKYDTRYCSVAAMKEGVNRIHEHVFQRAYLVKKILENPARLSDYFKHAVSCVVTDDENAALDEIDGKLIGWARYQAAGIVVLDRKTGKPADLVNLQEIALSQFGP